MSELIYITLAQFVTNQKTQTISQTGVLILNKLSKMNKAGERISIQEFCEVADCANSVVHYWLQKFKKDDLITSPPGYLKGIMPKKYIPTDKLISHTNQNHLECTKTEPMPTMEIYNSYGLGKIMVLPPDTPLTRPTTTFESPLSLSDQGSKLSNSVNSIPELGHISMSTKAALLEKKMRGE